MIDPYDHIDDYINGHLSEEDRSTFEALLAKDSDLKLAVDNHSVAMDVVGSLIEDEVRGVLGELETEEETKESSSKIISFNWKKWSAAASIIFIMGTVYYLTQTNTQKEQFAQRYTETKTEYILPEYDPTRGSVKENTIEYAKKQFYLQNYEKSKVSFEKLKVSSANNKDEINFYLGHIYYHQHQYQQSLKSLSFINKQSKWYNEKDNLEKIINYIISGKR